MPSNHLICCHPLLLLPSIFPRIRVFSNELALHIRWPKYWSFSFNISLTNKHPGQISLRMDWLDLLGSPCSPRDSQESSSTPQFKSINSSVLSLLYSPWLRTEIFTLQHVTLTQVSSISALMTFGPVNSLLWGEGCPVHYNIFSIICHLYQLDISTATPPPAMTTKSVSRYYSSLRTTALI